MMVPGAESSQQSQPSHVRLQYNPVEAAARKKVSFTLLPTTALIHLHTLTCLQNQFQGGFQFLVIRESNLISAGFHPIQGEAKSIFNSVTAFPRRTVIPKKPNKSLLSNKLSVVITSVFTTQGHEPNREALSAPCDGGSVYSGFHKEVQQSQEPKLNKHKK